MRISGRMESKNDELDYEVMAFYYLAKVLQYTKHFIEKNEAKRIRNQEVKWSGNICIPVEMTGTEVERLFTKIFSLAWNYAQDNVSSDYNIVKEIYYSHSKGFNEEVSDFTAYPEIAAAIQSFATSRKIRDGIYICFDIGGGTVDGVSFKFRNDDGDRQISLYQGKVENLGVDVTEEKIAGTRAELQKDYIKYALQYNRLEGICCDSQEKEVQTHVATVVYETKKRDGGDMIKKSPELKIMLSGGGASYEWYRKVIVDTHGKRSHQYYGIPQYCLNTINIPEEMDDDIKSHYSRLAIAYGLSITNKVEINGFPRDYHPIQRNIHTPEDNWERMLNIQKEKYGGKVV